MWGIKSERVLMTEYEPIRSVMALQATVSCSETYPAFWAPCMGRGSSDSKVEDCGVLEPELAPGSCTSWKGAFVGKDVGPQEAGSGFST